MRSNWHCDPPPLSPSSDRRCTAGSDRRFASGERLSLGVGSSESVATEHEQLGVPFERRGRVLDVVRGLWDGLFDAYDGDFVTLENANIGLCSTGTLPMYVASTTFDL